MHSEFHYKQVFCPVATKRIPISELRETRELTLFAVPNTVRDRDVILYDDNNKFPKDPGTRGTIYYMCEYIQRNLQIKSSEGDTRSNDFVLAFKRDYFHTSKQSREIVTETLIRILPHNCALLAVPPSETSRNGDTACHKVIHEICAKIGREKNIIDASDCLKRVKDKPSAHITGDRGIEGHIETIRLENGTKIQDKNIIILDDITTSGNSFSACAQIIEASVSVNSIAFFCVGRTIDACNMRAGFILDIDGTLFDTETGPIKSCRNRNPWSEELLALAQDARPMPGAHQLIDKFKDIGIDSCGVDYRLVTTSPKRYATVLAKKLGIEAWRVIAYESTGTGMQKPHPQPYLLAKQQMEIYEPSIIVIGDNPQKDIPPAQTLGMTSVLIGENNDKCNSNFSFPTLQNYVDNFWQTVQPAREVWEDFTSEYIKKQVEQLNKGIDEATKHKDDKPVIQKNFSRNSLAYLLAFSDVPGIGPATLRTHINELSSIETDDEIYALFEKIQKKSARVDQSVDQPGLLHKIALAHKALDEQNKLGIKTITLKSTDYQSLFSGNIYSPLYFFCIGNVNTLYTKSISILNLNLNEEFAKAKIQKFSKYIIAKGWNVITDEQCYMSSIIQDSNNDSFDNQKGTYVVVTSKPLDQVKNSDFCEKILKSGGCIISLALIGEWKKKPSWVNIMQLQAMLSKGIFAFGYNPAKEERTQKKNYYALLKNAQKPLLYYECTPKQLSDAPYMSCNDDIPKEVPGAIRMTYPHDIDDFLNNITK